MKNSSQIKHGVILSYLNIILTILISLFFIPFLIHTLGTSQYGMYALIGSFIGYFSIFDFGLMTTIIRYITKFRSAGQKDAESCFLGKVMIWYVYISFVILFFGCALYIFFPRMFAASFTFEEIKQARIMLIVVTISVCLTLPGRVYHGVITSYEHFKIIKIIPIIRNLIRITVCILILRLGYGALAITLVDAILSFLVLLVNRVYFYKILNIKINYQGRKNIIDHGIFNFSIYIFIAMVIEQINFRVDSIILGLIIGTSAVAVSGLASSILSIFRELSGAFLVNLQPKIMSKVYLENDLIVILPYLIKIGRFQLTVLGALYSGFLLFGKEFILLWVGAEFEMVWIIVMINMEPIVFSSTYSSFNYILQAKNKVKILTIINLSISFFNIIVTIGLVKLFGIIGAPIGTAFSYIIGDVFIILIYMKKHFKISLFLFFKSIFSGLFSSLAIACIGSNLVRNLYYNTNLGFFIRCLLFVCIYIGCLLLFGLSSEEKKWVSSIFYQKKNILKKLFGN